MKLYIIGPYRGIYPGDEYAIVKNVTRTVRAATALHNAGYAVYCPHIQSYHCAELNEDAGRELGHEDEHWLPLLAAWIPCCDGAATVGDIESSEGSAAEIQQFRDLDRPVRTWREWVDLAENG